MIDEGARARCCGRPPREGAFCREAGWTREAASERAHGTTSSSSSGSQLVSTTSLEAASRINLGSSSSCTSGGSAGGGPFYGGLVTGVGPPKLPHPAGLPHTLHPALPSGPRVRLCSHLGHVGGE